MVNFPSSDIFSPGTAVPDVADGELESPLIASWDAQAASSDATTKNRTARSAKHLLTVTNVPRDIFDARRGLR